VIENKESPFTAYTADNALKQITENNNLRNTLFINTISTEG
jgi:hypothetical protein